MKTDDPLSPEQHQAQHPIPHQGRRHGTVMIQAIDIPQHQMTKHTPLHLRAALGKGGAEPGEAGHSLQTLQQIPALLLGLLPVGKTGIRGMAHAMRGDAVVAIFAGQLVKPVTFDHVGYGMDAVLEEVDNLGMRIAFTRARATSSSCFIILYTLISIL